MLMWVWENVLVRYYPQIVGYGLTAFMVGVGTWRFAKIVMPLHGAADRLSSLPTKEDVSHIINASLDEKIEPDIRDIRERLVRVETKVETLWQDKYAPASSPRQLNARGIDIVAGSGIKAIVEGMAEDVFSAIKAKNPQHAYDAEQEVLDAVTRLPHTRPDLIPALKEGAFRTGADIDTVLFVGGIHLRNMLLPRLGFTLEEIDKKS